MTFVTCDIAMPIHQSPTPNCPVVTLSSLAIRNRCSPETIATTGPLLAQPSPGQARHPGRAADRAAQQCAILSSRVRGRIFQRLACRVGGDAGMAANHGSEQTSMQDRYVWQSCLRKPASKAGCMAALADCWGPREPFAHTLGSLPRLGWVFSSTLGCLVLDAARRQVSCKRYIVRRRAVVTLSIGKIDARGYRTRGSAERLWLHCIVLRAFVLMRDLFLLWWWWWWRRPVHRVMGSGNAFQHLKARTDDLD